MIAVKGETIFTTDAQSKPVFKAASILIACGSGLHLTAEINLEESEKRQLFRCKLKRRRRNEDLWSWHTVVWNNPRNFSNPLAVFVNNITDIHDIETVLLVFHIDYSFDDIHIIRRVVKDFNSVEIVRRHVPRYWHEPTQSSREMWLSGEVKLLDYLYVIQDIVISIAWIRSQSTSHLFNDKRFVEVNVSLLAESAFMMTQVAKGIHAQWSVIIVG